MAIIKNDIKVFILKATNLHEGQSWFEIYFSETEAQASLKFYYEKIKNKCKNIYKDFYKNDDFVLNHWRFRIIEHNSGLQSELLTNVNKDILLEREEK